MKRTIPLVLSLSLPSFVLAAPTPALDQLAAMSAAGGESFSAHYDGSLAASPESRPGVSASPVASRRLKTVRPGRPASAAEVPAPQGARRRAQWPEEWLEDHPGAAMGGFAGLVVLTVAAMVVGGPLMIGVACVGALAAAYTVVRVGILAGQAIAERVRARRERRSGS